MNDKKTGRRKWLTRLVWLFSLLAVFIGAYEVVLRARGLQPFRPMPFRAIIEPEFIYAPSYTLGYAPKPGKFKILMYDLDSLTYHATHNADSLRITRPENEENKYRNHERVYFFGGSFTYGAGVDDSLTFCWSVQKAFPELNILNCAVAGYGPIHALVQLKQLVQRGERPIAVILNYSFYHDNTSTLPRKSRANIARFSNIHNEEFMGKSRFPYIEMNGEDQINIKYVSFNSFYSPCPLREYSALVNFLEHKYNEFEAAFHDSHLISKHIIAEIHRLCLEYNITLIVGGMTHDDSTKEVLKFCSDRGVLSLDVSTDLNTGSIYRLHKDDSHPGVLAHTEYAKTYIGFFNANNVFNSQ